ncbi:MAG: hypothetical protein R3Y63_07660 [Eubacteriales bacterium]
MNWKVLDALDTKHSAINALLIVELESRRVVMANTLALKYFAGQDDQISLQKTLGRDINLQDLFLSVQEDLSHNVVTLMEDSVVEGKTGDDLECDISFTYATPEKKHIFMKIHPIINNKPYYLENFIATRKRPAFALNIHENLTVTHGNPLFYKAFACNKTSMKLRYKNYFGNLLSEENRQDYEAQIFAALDQAPMGKLDIPVQTAFGETLYFYYDTLRLRQVEDDFRNNLFCLLVGKDDNNETLTTPFDNS